MSLILETAEAKDLYLCPHTPGWVQFLLPVTHCSFPADTGHGPFTQTCIWHLCALSRGALSCPLQRLFLKSVSAPCLCL
jgi:hypothetical protein